MTIRPTKELSDIFVARFLEKDTSQRVRIADLLQTAEIHANWQFGRRGKQIFCAALRGRFGDDVVLRQDGDLVAAVRFTEAFPAAQAWSLPRFESVMNWPGLAAEPEEPAIVEDPQPSVEGNVRDRNAHERLDRLWGFASDANERLIKVEQRLGVLDDIDAGLDKRIDTVSTRLDTLEDEKREHCRKQANLESAFDERIFKLEFGPELREKKISDLENRMTALLQALREVAVNLHSVSEPMRLLEEEAKP